MFYLFIFKLCTCSCQITNLIHTKVVLLREKKVPFALLYFEKMLNGMTKTMIIEGRYRKNILRPTLVTFICIWILYGGLDAWPINTEIPGKTLFFVE